MESLIFVSVLAGEDHYELSHQRVRTLERYFYGEMLGQPSGDNWREALVKELQQPRLPISHFNALGWRVRRNYIWIYGAVLLAWLIKLTSSSPSINLPEAAQAGVVSGVWVLILVALFYVALLFLALRASVYHRLESD